MSLSLEGFMEAIRRQELVRQRLEKLLGFDPTTSDHYGIIRLYNQRITPETPDEEILAIRKSYLAWREGIEKIFAENGVPLADERFRELFSADGMYGTLYFLGIPLDIYGGAEPYRERITAYLRNEPIPFDD